MSEQLSGESNVKRTPAEWLALKHPGIRIMDPDGWRRDGLSMDEPLTYDDFSSRMAVSTLRGDIGAAS